MKRITIGCGTKFDCNGKLLSDLDRSEARKDIIEYCADVFGGVTFIDTYGAWKDDNGHLIIEPGWSIVAYVDNGQSDGGPLLAKFVRNALNQKTVYLTVEEIECKLV